MFFALFVLCLLSAHCYAAPIDIKSNVLTADIKLHIENFYVLTDTSSSATAADIFKRLNNNEGELSHGDVYSTGSSLWTKWLAVKVTNPESTQLDMVFEARAPHINRLELYKISNNIIDSIGSAGDLAKFSERQLQNNNFNFRFKLHPTETALLLLKIDNRGHVTILPFAIQSFDNHYSAAAQEYLVWGLLTGLLLFVCTFSLLIGITIRESIYFFYALYVFTLTFWIWCNIGLGYQFLFPNNPQLMGHIRMVALVFGLVLLLHVMQLFTNQSKANSRFYTATNYIKATLFFLGLALFIPYDYTNNKWLIIGVVTFSDVLGISAMVVLVAGLIEKIRQGQKSAWMYLSAISLFFISALLSLFVRLGIIPASVFSLNGVYVGIVVEVFIFSIALGMRYKALKKEGQRLWLSLENQKTESQYQLELATIKERTRIAADLHDDIGSGISGLRLFVEMAGRKNSIEEIKNDTLTISETVNILADKISDIVWALDGDSKDIENFLLYIQKHGIRFFKNSSTVFSMDIPIQLPDVELSPDAQKHLILVMKELFNNGLKHAEATLFECKVTFTDVMQIVVKDNGRGFDINHQPTGNGLKNIRNRIAGLNGTVTINAASGTCYTITIPLLPKRGIV